MIAETDTPRLAPGVRLHFDRAREAWVLLAPERIIETGGPTPAILKLCDGTRSTGAIIDSLAETFAAERAIIAADVVALLGDLLTKHLIRIAP